jgi:hypothetical protein
MILIALLACAPEPEGDGLTLLSPREQLIRVSVELRGVHPSEEELLAIEADPTLYTAFAERYLADPRVSERIREIFDTRWWTRTGDTYFDAEEAGVSVREADLARSVGDEPLRLLSYVFDQELPYSELVTASYTMADPLLVPADLFCRATLNFASTSATSFTYSAWNSFPGESRSGSRLAQKIFWNSAASALFLRPL